MDKFYVRARETGYMVLPSGSYELAVSSAKKWAAKAGYEVMIINKANDLPVTIVSPDGSARQA